MKILVAVVGGVFLGWMILFAAFMFGSGVKVVQHSESGDFSTTVLERTTFPFGVRHQVAVGRGRFDAEGYYGAFREIGPIEEPQQVLIEWREDGVEVSEKSGHKTFIPKSSYEGGR